MPRMVGELPPELLTAAEATAITAADRAQVKVRQIDDLTGLADVCQLFRLVWHSADGAPPTTIGLLRALAHTGNYVAGAFAQQRLVAGAVAFLGLGEQSLTLFSNQIAVAPQARLAGIGFAIKQHQRLWALRRGIREINWTYDPLMVRNGFFFIHKIGAVGHDYLPNFYGNTYDVVEDDSDRVFARWDLTDAHQPCQPDPVPAPIALGVSATQSPHWPDPSAVAAPSFRVQLPMDIAAIRRSAPELARDWRRASRQAIAPAMASGYRIVDVSRDGFYTLARA